MKVEMSSSNQSTDSGVAIIKFVVGIERIRQTFPDLDIIGLPDWLLVDNGGVRCDMAIGPCSCGAWHYTGEERTCQM